MGPRGSAGNGVEILIVEDSPTQAEKLKYVLEGQGYTVTGASNGKAALAAVRKRKPGLVLSDVLMPEMDGFTLCKEIKSQETLKDIPIILMTSLSYPHDIMKGLECGADNFIRKPFDEKYLLSHIEFILVNRELRRTEKAEFGIEIYFAGSKYVIASERQQILDLLISTYEDAVRLNADLQAREKELTRSFESLAGLYRIAEGLNKATSEQEVLKEALEQAMELPGVQAGWVSLREGEASFRLACAINIPPALETPGAMDGDCLCRRKLLAGELDRVANILECERLRNAKGDTRGLRCHASIPLWAGNRTMGVLNLAGADQGLFHEEDLKMLDGVGNQVAMAIERAQLLEGLERRVEERTAALKAEIDERKRAKEALRESEERYRTLFENMLEGFAYCKMLFDDRGHAVDWVYLGVNKAFEQLTGLKNIVGKKVTEAIPEIKASNPELFEIYGRVALTGQPARFEVEVKPLAMWLTISVVSPEKEHFVAVFEDITERKQAEGALKQSEERYRFLFEANPLPMWIYDTETFSFLAVNDSAIAHYGYSREEFLGMTIKDIRPSEDTPALLEDVSGTSPVLSDTRVWRHRKKDGSIIDVEITSHVLPFGKGQTRLVLANDITERKGLEHQLRQAQKMEAVGRLAGGIAHDFNNLLTVISGYSQMLLARLASGDPQHEHVEEIKKAGDRAATLTRQLLAFSRRQVLQPQVLDLNAVIASTEKMLCRLIGEDIDLVAVQGEALWPVRADPGQIEQVIMNLAVNSRDAMPRGGKLTIETANVDLDDAYARSHVTVAPGPYVMLAISDTGCGMDAETQSRIFEPFFTTKEQGKGTGLGLSTVYGIVKQSGGNIWVYSEPGRGATFKIYLPRVKVAVEAEGPAQAGAAPLRGSETILVVEDEDAVRSLVRGVLEANGYKVLEASRAVEALSICDRHEGTIHLMLTDVVMPTMSGRVLAGRLAPARPTMKVLYMSGYTEGAIVNHGVLDENIAFLQKPFTPDLLARKVREVLDH